jgi:hypothetical protein
MDTEAEKSVVYDSRRNRFIERKRLFRRRIELNDASVNLIGVRLIDKSEGPTQPLGFTISYPLSANFCPHMSG